MYFNVLSLPYISTHKQEACTQVIVRSANMVNITPMRYVFVFNYCNYLKSNIPFINLKVNKWLANIFFYIIFLH